MSRYRVLRCLGLYMGTGSGGFGFGCCFLVGENSRRSIINFGLLPQSGHPTYSMFPTYLSQYFTFTDKSGTCGFRAPLSWLIRYRMVTIRFSFVQHGGHFRGKKVYTNAVDEQQKMLDTEAFMKETKKGTKGRTYQKLSFTTI